MATRPLAELIAEHNKLAQAKAPQRPFTVVRVLMTGRYNGPDLKAQNAQAGELIAVAGGRYAQDLISSGFVEIPVEEPELGDDSNEESQEPAPSNEDAQEPEPNDDSNEEPQEPAPSSEESQESEPGDDSGEEPQGPEDVHAVPSIGELRSLAKAAGINSHGMSKAELIEALQGA